MRSICTVDDTKHEKTRALCIQQNNNPWHRMRKPTGSMFKHKHTQQNRMCPLNLQGYLTKLFQSTQYTVQCTCT